jgi:hypothetical protein
MSGADPMLTSALRHWTAGLQLIALQLVRRRPGLKLQARRLRLHQNGIEIVELLFKWLLLNLKGSLAAERP